MKKIFSLAMMALAVMFASCSQDDTLAEANDSKTTLSFTANLPSDAISTRADASVKRYVMELFEVGTEGNTQVEVTSGAKKIEQATSTFKLDASTLSLKMDTKYIAVFWADYDDPASSSATYNIDDLSKVSLNTGKSVGMAYCGTAEFTYGMADATYTVTLKRIVAQMNLLQSKAITSVKAASIAITYDEYAGYNAVTGAPDATSTKVSTTATCSVAAADNIAKDTALGSFYVIAPSSEQALSDFKVSLTWNPDESGSTAVDLGTMSNVPLQANYKTNITAGFLYQTMFGFTASIEDTWNSEENSYTKE